MPAFQLLAYLSPLLVGFAVPAALAMTRGKPPARRAAAAGLTFAGILLVLFATSLAVSVGYFWPLALLLAALAALVAAVHLLLESLRAPSAAGQLAAGLLAVALVSTVWIFGPAVAEAGETGAPTHGRISLLLQANPYMVIGYAVFGADLLRSEQFYTSVDLAGFPFDTPRLGPAVLGYAAAGLLLGGAAFGLSALRRRRAAGAA